MNFLEEFFSSWTASSPVLETHTHCLALSISVSVHRPFHYHPLVRMGELAGQIKMNVILE